MKSIIITCIVMMFTFEFDASAQRLRIGHRNSDQVAVLDISIASIQPTIVQELTFLNYTNITVTNLDISDNVFYPGYYASIGISVEYQEPGSPDVLKLSFLYPIVYDAAMNAYYGGKPNIPHVQDGGKKGEKNPDNNFCAARNCRGCPTFKDENGKTMGCGECIPFNDKPFSCAVENTSGMGAERVITALGNLIKGLIGLF